MLKTSDGENKGKRKVLLIWLGPISCHWFLSIPLEKMKSGFLMFPEVIKNLLGWPNSSCESEKSTFTCSKPTTEAVEKKCEIRSKSIKTPEERQTIITPERRQWRQYRRSGVFIINFSKLRFYEIVILIWNEFSLLIKFYYSRNRQKTYILLMISGLI